MKTKNKPLYNLEKSPLYRIGTKKDLAKILGISLKSLKSLMDDGKYYTQKKENKGKSRELQVPFGKLRIVHERIKDLLSRINLPNYVKFAKKGSRIVLNAKPHAQNTFVLKMDISNFYPSCKQKFIYNFFIHIMKMTSDVAYIISNISTYKGILPTGSPLSQILGFYANRGVFNEIYNLCEKEGITFTLYVDDLTFSFDKPIPNSLKRKIKKLLEKTELFTKKSKQKMYGPNENKLVTGVAISKDRILKVPNKLRFKIKTIISKYTKLDLIPKNELLSLQGCISQGRLIEPNFMATTNIKIKKILYGKNSQYNLVPLTKKS